MTTASNRLEPRRRAAWPRVWQMAIVAVVAAGAGPLPAAAPSDPAAAAPYVLTSIPPRPADALGGSAFVDQLRTMPPAARQRALLREITRGNVPRFLRRLQPVSLMGRSRSSRTRTATVWVMPDYLAVGSDADFVRVPLDFYTATALAEEFGLVLPTRKIVNAVYRQATVRLSPIPMEPGPRMRSPAYVLAHNRQIELARNGRRVGTLTAGHKKDLVLTRRLTRRPPRVAIYGWHRREGDPIQPLSTVHGAAYTDYSHGVRLVASSILVESDLHDMFAVLADRRLASLVSDEGPIPDAWRLLHHTEKSGEGVRGG